MRKFDRQHTQVDGTLCRHVVRISNGAKVTGITQPLIKAYFADAVHAVRRRRHRKVVNQDVVGCGLDVRRFLLFRLDLGAGCDIGDGVQHERFKAFTCDGVCLVQLDVCLFELVLLVGQILKHGDDRRFLKELSDVILDVVRCRRIAFDVFIHCTFEILFCGCKVLDRIRMLPAHVIERKELFGRAGCTQAFEICDDGCRLFLCLRLVSLAEHAPNQHGESLACHDDVRRFLAVVVKLVLVCRHPGKAFRHPVNVVRLAVAEYACHLDGIGHRRAFGGAGDNVGFVVVHCSFGFYVICSFGGQRL